MSEQLQDFPSDELEEYRETPKKGLNLRAYLRTFQRKSFADCWDDYFDNLRRLLP